MELSKWKIWIKYFEVQLPTGVYVPEFDAPKLSDVSQASQLWIVYEDLKAECTRSKQNSCTPGWFSLVELFL